MIESIKINKNIPISCPNEANKNMSHPKIFLNKKNTTCKYCNTHYEIQ